MKNSLFFILIAMILSGCQQQIYPSIYQDQPFVASLNLQNSTLSFVNEKAEDFATWEFDKQFTGGILVNQSQDVLLFGYQLNKVYLYSLDKGELLGEWQVGEGITAAIEVGDEIALANAKLNEIIFLNKKGAKIKTVDVGAYPLDMKIKNGELFVINYKDTLISVIDLRRKEVDREFEIPSSSAGLFLKDDEVWIGGHGQGSKPREGLLVYSSQRGEIIRSVQAGTMPINMIEDEQRYYVVSHGSNEIHLLSQEYEVIKFNTVGANPFAISTFSNRIIVAGYDSNELYFLNKQNLQIEKTVPVGKGPFVLLTRE
ncbi:hypothetical protein [Bacillus sp. 2205SS5-2]|uniref:hypothetical protein n=1 Tax=Bacillus sp. 2205SS5-2 TaxID=3109031 RepID=UPI003005AE7A